MNNNSIYINDVGVSPDRQLIDLSDLFSNTSISAGDNLRLAVFAYLNIKTDSINSDTPEFRSGLAVVNNRYTTRPQIKTITNNSANGVGEVIIVAEPNGAAITQLAYLAIAIDNTILHYFYQDIDNPNILSSIITSTNTTTKDVTITLQFDKEIRDIKVSVGNNNGFDFK